MAELNYDKVADYALSRPIDFEHIFQQLNHYFQEPLSLEAVRENTPGNFSDRDIRAIYCTQASEVVVMEYLQLIIGDTPVRDIDWSQFKIPDDVFKSVVRIWARNATRPDIENLRRITQNVLDMLIEEGMAASTLYDMRQDTSDKMRELLQEVDDEGVDKEPSIELEPPPMPDMDPDTLEELNTEALEIGTIESIGAAIRDKLDFPENPIRF